MTLNAGRGGEDGSGQGAGSPALAPTQGTEEGVPAGREGRVLGFGATSVSTEMSGTTPSKSPRSRRWREGNLGAVRPRTFQVTTRKGVSQPVTRLWVAVFFLRRYFCSQNKQAVKPWTTCELHARWATTRRTPPARRTRSKCARSPQEKPVLAFSLALESSDRAKILYTALARLAPPSGPTVPLRFPPDLGLGAMQHMHRRAHDMAYPCRGDHARAPLPCAAS